MTSGRLPIEPGGGGGGGGGKPPPRRGGDNKPDSHAGRQEGVTTLGMSAVACGRNCKSRSALSVFGCSGYYYKFITLIGEIASPIDVGPVKQAQKKQSNQSIWLSLS
jgi:hypothetical protein